MPNIFISYRRSDTKREAETLYHNLSQAFSAEEVFMDQHSLPLGEFFPDYLFRVVAWSDVVIVLIGANWDKEKLQSGQLRIENKNDYVRKEIEIALFKNKNNGTPIIPITVGNNVKLSSIHIPKELTDLRSFNGLEFSSLLNINNLTDLITSINRKLSGTNTKDNLLAPKIAIQYIDIYQSMNIYGGPIYDLPKDAVIIVYQKNGVWQVEIQCESEPQYDRYRGTINTSELYNKPIEHMIGALMEWYDISKNQCRVRKKTSNNDSILDFLSLNLKFSDKNAYEYVEFFGNPIYSSLAKLILEFNRYSHNEMVDMQFVVGNNMSIPETFQVLGVPDDVGIRSFGEYICTLTHDLGGKDKETGDLVYFPNIKGTNLQYLDIFNRPHIEKLKYVAHIGKGINGYHLYFVP